MAIPQFNSSPQAALAQWQSDGYIILRNHFTRTQCEALNEFTATLWQERHSSPSKATIDIFLDRPENKRVLLSQAPDEAFDYSFKINDLYLDEPLIRDYALDPGLCQTLNLLLDGKALAFNTLLFRWGSQQQEHTDTLYMPPRKTDKLVVSWIALDEANADNGAVTLYPGSHLIPPHRFSDGRLNAIGTEMGAYYDHMAQELKSRGIEPLHFNAEPGDVLIWHAQLLHGGSPIKDWQKTRRSLVTHYYRKQEYLHQFWRLRKHGGGYYLKRPHPSPDKD